MIVYYFFFFFNDTATTEIYTLSLHDALPLPGGHGIRQGGVDRLRARGVRVHLLLRDALDLVALAVGARNPLHAEFLRQAALRVRGDDGLDSAQDLGQHHRVQRAILPVAHGLDDARDLVVDVVLRVAVAAGPLKPGRYRDQCLLKP